MNLTPTQTAILWRILDPANRRRGKDIKALRESLMGLHAQRGHKVAPEELEELYS